MIQLYLGKVNIFNEKNITNCKSQIKQLEKQIIEYENNYNYGYIECPKCRSTKLIYYGSYERYVIARKKELKIRIKRVFCKECASTHSIIPSFILPYYQYELSYINMVLFLAKVRKQKKRYLEYVFKITRQLIRKWEKRYEEHYVYLTTTYKEEKEEEIFYLLRQAKNLKKYELENKMRYMSKIPT